MFLIPILYTLKTRYDSFSKVVVYVLTYLVPELLLLLLESWNKDLPIVIAVYFLSMISYITIYETGYIWNDTETVKKESNPTKRLTEIQLSQYEQKKAAIYAERILLAVLLNGCLSFFISVKALIFFSGIEFFTMLVYWIYNHLRGKTIMLFYFFLISARYISVCICFIENFSPSVLLAALFVFPVVRTMEYKAHYGTDSDINLFFRKYVIKYDISRITVFRVWATLALLCVSVALRVLHVCNWIPAIVCAYMFLYRLALFAAIKSGAQFKGYLKR